VSIAEDQLQGDIPSQTTEQRRVAAQAALHEKIRLGLVDIGPFPDQSKPIVDIRDQRDPRGSWREAIQEVVRVSLILQPSGDDEIDEGKHGEIAKFNGAPVNHAATRLRELEERAAQGDRFAQALLRGESLAEDPTD
jgi:hypothetical protein